MSDAVLLSPGGGATPSFAPVDISGTLAAGRWALLSGDVVVGVEVRDPTGRFPDALDVVDASTTPDVAAGWKRAGGRLVAPEPPPDPAPSRAVSAAAFYDLFTPAERAALCGVSEFTAEALRVLLQGYANLASPALAEMLGKAVTAGLLTDARARQIAAGTPPV